MVTAEDDSTAVLRMTRGTVLGPCALCVPAPLEVRAATFCTAHVLSVADLWRTAAKYGRTDEQTTILWAAVKVSKPNSTKVCNVPSGRFMQRRIQGGS